MLFDWRPTCIPVSKSRRNYQQYLHTSLDNHEKYYTHQYLKRKRKKERKWYAIWEPFPVKWIAKVDKRKGLADVMGAVGRNSRLNALFVTNQKSRQPLQPTTSSACHYRSNKGLKASRELMHESTKTPNPPPLPPRDKVGIWKKPWGCLLESKHYLITPPPGFHICWVESLATRHPGKWAPKIY